MMVKGFTKGLLLMQLPALISGAKTPIYKDANAPVEKRVKDLLGRMTIEDKMAQLMQGISVFMRTIRLNRFANFSIRGYYELDESNIRGIQ